MLVLEKADADDSCADAHEDVCADDAASADKGEKAKPATATERQYGKEKRCLMVLCRLVGCVRLDWKDYVVLVQGCVVVLSPSDEL